MWECGNVENFHILTFPNFHMPEFCILEDCTSRRCSRLSMQSTALKALEFDRIVEAVCRLAQTPPGSDLLARLHPLSDAGAVSSALATTDETARFLSGTGEIALRAPAEFDAIVAALSIEERALEPLQLLGLSMFLASVDATVTGIRRARATFPRLGAIVETAACLDR